MYSHKNSGDRTTDGPTDGRSLGVCIGCRLAPCPHQYKTILTSIHTAAVTQTIADLGTNHLINVVPPAICISEKSLKRRERTLLAQLRTGDCICLLSYLMRIPRAPDAFCPECRVRAILLVIYSSV